MQSAAALALQAELHGSSGAKKWRHQDDNAQWYTAIPKIDLGCSGNLLQRFLEIVRLETEWAGCALVRDPVRLIDQVDAIGPTCVGALRLVVESVDHCRELNSQLTYAAASHLGALVEIPGARENNFVSQIALGLPDVARVRLDDVDNQERDLLAVLVIEFVEGGNLPPEGRSGVAAEDKHDRLLRGERGELHVRRLIEFDQRKIGSGIAGLQSADAGMHPHGLERSHKEYRIGHVLHDTAEGLRRLMHRPPDQAHKKNVDDHQHNGRASEKLPHRWVGIIPEMPSGGR